MLAFRPLKPKKFDSSGFTLIEIVFVVFLVGVISAFAYPYIDSAIDEGRYMECEGQLEAIRRAKSLYTVDHLGEQIDLANNDPERAVFESYFVNPPSTMGANGLLIPPHCPRVGLDEDGLPLAPYDAPYNLYRVSTCPYCSQPGNIPSGVRPYIAEP
jgi:prepilin-type N-terminal cleavage/methylation domain-containing protein